jgi:ATP-dependent Lon protease
MDPSLEAELDLSYVSYVATANDDTLLPPPLRDRFRVVRMPAPTLAYLPALAAQVVAAIAHEAGEQAEFYPDLEPDELAVIGKAWFRRGLSMRQLQKIVSATLDARAAYAMRH